MPKEKKTDAITPELFNHLVKLGALELSPEEGEYMRQELNNQLKAIDQLEAVPLDENTEATSHGIHYTPEITTEIRSDECKPYSDTEEIISQAPETKGGYYIVPDIPHTELD